MKISSLSHPKNKQEKSTPPDQVPNKNRINKSTPKYPSATITNIGNLIDKINQNQLNNFYDDKIKEDSFKENIDKLNLKFYLETEKILHNEQNNQGDKHNSQEDQNKLFLILFEQINLYINEIERLNKIILSDSKDPKVLQKRIDILTQQLNNFNTKELIIQTLKHSNKELEKKLSQLLISENKLREENESLKNRLKNYEEKNCDKIDEEEEKKKLFNCNNDDATYNSEMTNYKSNKSNNQLSQISLSQSISISKKRSMSGNQSASALLSDIESEKNLNNNLNTHNINISNINPNSICHANSNSNVNSNANLNEFCLGHKFNSYSNNIINDYDNHNNIYYYTKGSHIHNSNINKLLCGTKGKLILKNKAEKYLHKLKSQQIKNYSPIKNKNKISLRMNNSNTKNISSNLNCNGLIYSSNSNSNSNIINSTNLNINNVNSSELNTKSSGNNINMSNNFCSIKKKSSPHKKKINFKNFIYQNKTSKHFNNLNLIKFYKKDSNKQKFIRNKNSNERSEPFLNFSNSDINELKTNEKKDNLEKYLFDVKNYFSVNNKSMNIVVGASKGDKKCSFAFNNINNPKNSSMPKGGRERKYKDIFLHKTYFSNNINMKK